MTVELTESVEARANARIQLLDRPLVAPGKCACCGAVDRPSIDFGFDLDFYGVVYLCIHCITYAASLMGLEKPQKEEVEAQLTRRENIILKQLLGQTNELANDIVAVINRFDVRDDNLSSVLPIEDSREIDDSAGSVFAEPIGPSGQDDRSVIDERSFSISADSSDESRIPKFGI